MKRPHDPLRLDVASFAGEAGELAGHWPGNALERLAESQAPPQDVALDDVRWQVRGERRAVTGGEAELWLALSADTRVWLSCQRCLQPFEIPLGLARRIRFVRGEAQAEALDAEFEDDVLALSRTLDLRELVEDELLLALPLVPRHSSCPQPPAMSSGDDEAEADGDAARPHPFAALKALKTGGGGD